VSERGAQLLARLVGFPTVAGHSNEALIDWTAEQLEDAGAAVRMLPGPRADGHSLHAVLGPADEPGVLLAAHTDVVAVDGQSWSHDPFALRVDGDRFYGRGAADMKGFIAAVLAAAPGTRTLRRPLHLALSVDEELGCRGTPALLSALAIAPPRWCVVGEPTRMRVVERHKGKLAFRVEVHGRACHSSRAPEGVNAVEYAARFIVALRDVEDELRACTDDRFGVPFATVSVGPIRGGVALNIVPDACTFEAEVRLLPGQDPAAVLARIRDLAAGLEAQMGEGGIEVAELTRYPGLASSDAAAEIAALADASRNGSVDFGTEAGLYQAALNVPVVVCGPGDMAQAHVADEYLEADQLERAERFIRRIGDALAA
jgi:acetylornithine deacetylase